MNRSHIGYDASSEAILLAGGIGGRKEAQIFYYLVSFDLIAGLESHGLIRQVPNAWHKVWNNPKAVKRHPELVLDFLLFRPFFLLFFFFFWRGEKKVKAKQRDAAARAGKLFLEGAECLGSGPHLFI